MRESGLVRERDGVADRWQAASAAPGVEAGLIPHLQATAGNQAVQQLLGARRAPAPTHASVTHRQPIVRNRAVARGVSRKDKEVSGSKRRALKLRVVAGLTNVAEAGTAGAQNPLTAEQGTQVVVAFAAFYGPLTDAEKNTLKTAKGFSSSPDGLENPSATLFDFLDGHSDGTGCGAGFSKDCALWAAHVVNMNPDRVKLQAAWPAQKARIDAARQAVLDDIGAWYDNPRIRKPWDNNTVRYYLAFLVQNDDVKEGKNLGQFDDVRGDLHEEFPFAGLKKWKYEEAKKYPLAVRRQQAGV